MTEGGAARNGLPFARQGCSQRCERFKIKEVKHVAAE